MMAVTTKGLCATIALICVIVPMIVGHVMPTGTEERTVYESGNLVNITSDLVNESEVRYQEYISDFNNSFFISYMPVSITENQSPIPYKSMAAWVSQHYIDHTPTAFDPVGDLYVTGLLGDITIPDYIPRHFTYEESVATGSFTFTHKGIQYVASDIWYLPDRSMFMAIGEFGSLVVHDDFPDSAMPSNESYLIYTLSDIGAEESNQYVDLSQGGYLSMDQGGLLYGIKGPVFSNGYKNARVGFNIENLQPTARTHTLTIYDDDSFTTVNLSWGGSGWTLSNGSDSVLVGSFKQIFVDVDAKNDEIRVSSLARGGFSDNPYPRIIKTYTLPLADPLDGIDVIAFSESGDKLARGLVYSTDIPSGTQNYIIDKTVNLANYYPMDSIIADINGNAFYGDSVTFPGIGTVPVDQGRITFNDVTGEERTVKLRDSTIAATYEDETQKYSVALNGYTIAEDLSAADLNFTFNGKWLFNLMIASLTPRVIDEYVFSFSTLNITMQEYALIGVVTSLLAFVACALVGKRSGTKMIPMLLISGLGFMIYVAMLL